MLLAVLSALSASAPPLLAWQGKQEADEAYEEFESIDPYTRNDPEAMQELGYSAFAPFLWHKGERTDGVRETMGGMSMLFVETEHFKIGSTLTTYELPNDREERAKVADELARLKKKVRFRPPRKELDPWLRLHLYAQRVEDTYATFLRDFGIETDDFISSGPHLGQPGKFLVLLCQRKSELARYVKAYMNAEVEDVFRWGFAEDSFFVGASMESIELSWQEPDEEPFDAMLHCTIVANLAANLLDAYRGNFYAAPRWLTFAIGHHHVRRIDPRWITSAGHRPGHNRREDDWNWSCASRTWSRATSS